MLTGTTSTDPLLGCEMAEDDAVDALIGEVWGDLDCVRVEDTAVEGVARVLVEDKSGKDVIRGGSRRSSGDV